MSFSPPNAPPISAPDGPILTFTIPQSDPTAEINVSASCTLSVKIQEDTKLLSEGTGTVVGTSATVSGTAATTAADTQIEVDEDPARAFVFDPGIELQTLVDALNETGTTATDMVAILEALREAGALRAELIII